MIDSITHISDDLTLSPRMAEELTYLFKSYIPALKKNILKRFDESSDIVIAFSVLKPITIPEVKAQELKEYGLEDITLLGKHFFKSDERVDKLVTDWKSMKYHINDIVMSRFPWKSRMALLE